MNFSENINIENILKFIRLLAKKYGNVESHIKFPEYSISIPDNKQEFSDLMEEMGWKNIYYILLFVKPNILIKFDFLKKKINLKCDPPDLEKEVEDLINHNF